MASLNNCMFIGNVGKIETRYMTNGEAVTNISLAVNENYKNKEGEKVEKVEWVQCVIYRKLAEIANEYVKVGAPLYLAGKLQTRKWADKDGNDRYTTEIIVNEMQMLGGKPDSASNINDKPAQPAGNARPDKPPVQKPSSFDNFDDDIPFAAAGMPGAGVSWRAM